MHQIELRGITRKYGSLFAIDNLSVVVKHGGFVVVVGKSGAGKSTLLRILAGLESTDEGQVLIAGQDQTAVSPAKRGVALVTQDAALYPQLSVAQNLRVRLKSLGANIAQRRIDEALDVFGIKHLMARLPSELSGGEAQRVALARATTIRPQILLLDEPFSQLDALVKEPILQLLKETVRTNRMTTLMVSHDPYDSLRLADRIAVLDAGRLLQYDSPRALYHRPQTRLAGDLLSPVPMNWVDSQGNVTQAWRDLFQTVAGGKRFLGFRPEDVELAKLDEQPPADKVPWLPLRVESVQFIGFALLLLGRLDGQSVRIQVQPNQMPDETDWQTIGCRIDKERICAVDG